MAERPRCLGFSASNTSRCQRKLGHERIDLGRLTCITHEEQEPVARSYHGSHQDSQAIVEHHLRALGVIPSGPGQKPIEQAESTGADSKVDTPEYFHPDRILNGGNAEGPSWDAFGGGLTTAYFQEGLSEEALKNEYENGFRSTAFEVLGKRPKEAGLIVASAAAFISSIGLVLYYLILGFGFQAVTVERNNISTMALGAGLLATTMLVIHRFTKKAKDESRLRVHVERYKEVSAHLKERAELETRKQELARSESNRRRAQKFGESAQSVSSLLAQLDALTSTKTGFLRKIWSRIVNLFVGAKVAEPLHGQKSSVDPKSKSARDLVKLKDMPTEDKIDELKSRKSEYVQADKDQSWSQKVLARQNRIVDLNAKIRATEAELGRLKEGEIWPLLLVAKVPVLLAGLSFLLAVVGIAFTSLLVARNHKDYCETQSIPWVRCHYLEVKRPAGSSGVTKQYNPVFVVGRVSDQLLVLFPQDLPKAPQTEKTEIVLNPDKESKISPAELGSAAEQEAHPEPAPKRQAFELARLRIPAASVIALQGYGKTFDRLGIDAVSPPPAPVINLAQENSFVTINNTPHYSGGSGVGEIFNVNYDAKFPFTQTDVTRIAMNNHFESKVEEHAHATLITNFILDGKQMNQPGNGELRHILAPFFLNPIETSKPSSKWREIYALYGNRKIDTKLDAFIAGFFSLRDPAMTESEPSSAGLDRSLTFLSTVRTILEACTAQVTDTVEPIRIEVAGYASKKPFRGADGKEIEGSSELNHALAEGRRAAILVNLVDLEMFPGTERQRKAWPHCSDQECRRSVCVAHE